MEKKKQNATTTAVNDTKKKNVSQVSIRKKNAVQANATMVDFTSKEKIINYMERFDGTSRNS